MFLENRTVFALLSFFFLRIIYGGYTKKGGKMYEMFKM